MQSVRWLFPRIISRPISLSAYFRDNIVSHDNVSVYWNTKLCHNPTEANLTTLEFMNLSDIQRRERALFIPYFTDGSILKVVWTDKASPSGLCEMTGMCVHQSEPSLNVATTFILRNVIRDEGVNITFEKYSPIIQSIDLIRFQKIEWSKEGETMEDYPLSASKIPANLSTLLTDPPLSLKPNKAGPVVAEHILYQLVKKKEVRIVNTAQEIKEMYDPFYKWYLGSQEVPKEITYEANREQEQLDDRQFELEIRDIKY
eukprot:TRINITY_DN1692_c0_g2_i5.p2 TRINITY_DN1692_c0_g2~~TRINITY_DN1692_c0_g2_i5.p2  ORF type:complete len:258 (+),score=50.53 TRINITY_DN1692_c0_g2_i5:118-891(+)